MKKVIALGGIVLSLIISSCSSTESMQVIPSYNARVSLDGTDAVRFSISEFSEDVGLYDNFKDVSKPPEFLWVMPCGNTCDNPVWLSPNAQVSSIILPPVELVRLSAGGEFTRKFLVSQLMTAVKVYDMSEIERIKIKVRVFFDESLSVYEDIESDWLLIQ